MRELLKKFGYCTADDAIEFVMAGLGILPGLLMLSGFMMAGAATLFVLLLLLAFIGLHVPAPPPKDEAGKKHQKPMS